MTEDAWTALAHAPAPSLGQLFESEPDRLSRLAVEEQGIRFDLSKTHLSEALLKAFLDLNTIPYDNVVSIFSEREPCTSTPRYCSELLRGMRVGPEKVTYSFEYGPTKDSQDRGNARLTEVVTTLLRARGGLPMAAPRDPRSDDY